MAAKSHPVNSTLSAGLPTCSSPNLTHAMLTFYFAPGSSSMAPHIALQEIGVTFESRPLSFARKENRAAAFLAINPESKGADTAD